MARIQDYIDDLTQRDPRQVVKETPLTMTGPEMVDKGLAIVGGVGGMGGLRSAIESRPVAGIRARLNQQPGIRQAVESRTISGLSDRVQANAAATRAALEGRRVSGLSDRMAQTATAREAEGVALRNAINNRNLGGVAERLAGVQVSDDAVNAMREAAKLRYGQPPSITVPNLKRLGISTAAVGPIAAYVGYQASKDNRGAEAGTQSNPRASSQAAQKPAPQAATNPANQAETQPAPGTPSRQRGRISQIAKQPVQQAQPATPDYANMDEATLLQEAMRQNLGFMEGGKFYLSQGTVQGGGRLYDTASPEEHAAQYGQWASYNPVPEGYKVEQEANPFRPGEAINQTLYRAMDKESGLSELRRIMAANAQPAAPVELMMGGQRLVQTPDGRIVDHPSQPGGAVAYQRNQQTANRISSLLAPAIDAGTGQLQDKDYAEALTDAYRSEANLEGTKYSADEATKRQGMGDSAAMARERIQQAGADRRHDASGQRINQLKADLMQKVIAGTATPEERALAGIDAKAKYRPVMGRNELGQETGDVVGAFNEATGEFTPLGGRTAPRGKQYAGRRAVDPRTGQAIPEGTVGQSGGMRMVVKNGVWTLAE